MSDERFDCIIVGGGLAGLTSAYVLAAAGIEVLLIEKGNYSGAKNMTGGRLYSHSLEKVIANFAETAPLERKIVKERFSRGSAEILTLEYDSSGLLAPAGESYTVLRGKFDRWLADQAEEQGAMLVHGVRVDNLLIDDHKVYGVIAGDEEMEADVVILADGVNSLLGQKLGYKTMPLAKQAVLGVKELIGLSEKIIDQRFNITDDSGVAWMLSGCGDVYDGFIYTNKDSISIGITMTLDDIDKTGNSAPQMLEDFKNHPQIAPLVAGGRLLEYSAHLIPESKENYLPQLYGAGVLLAGDAAALCANLGFTLRGMDLAIESGLLAAQTVIMAKHENDFSTQSLALYKKKLENSFIMNCLKSAENCRNLTREVDFNSDPLNAFNNVLKNAGIK
ncbi:MAG: FAD-dependent oxidoreductase [Firmicutes bacterium]|nr:FAD-dependent oxidoreductase [Bacillota bacterium]